MADDVKDSELERAIDESLRAYADGDASFFDYLKDDVRVYNLNDAEPMVGRKEFESAYRPLLEKHDVSVIKRDLRSSDGQGVLAQTLQITKQDVSVYVRQTVVWEQGDKGWQMSHIHNTLVGQPVAQERPDSARAVRVLNERIATVAAAVGVAQ